MYDSEGKRKARDLLIDVARMSGCETFLDFWGGGVSARQAVAAGLAVTSAEKDRSLQTDLVEDARKYGYIAHLGDAIKVEGKFDVVFADFCGNANPVRFNELRLLATKTKKWLAVTIAPDHQLDTSMQGEAALYTIPSWLVGATRMRLMYVCRYIRGSTGTTMWFAILEPKSSYRAEHAPYQVARNLQGRGSYWSARRFGRMMDGRVRRHPLVRDFSVKTPGKCLFCGRKLSLSRRASTLYCNNLHGASFRRRPKEPVICACGTKFMRASKPQRYCTTTCPSKREHTRTVKRARLQRLADGAGIEPARVSPTTA